MHDTRLLYSCRVHCNEADEVSGTRVRVVTGTPSTSAQTRSDVLVPRCEPCPIESGRIHRLEKMTVMMQRDGPELKHHI